MEEQKLELINLIVETKDEECIYFLLGCMVEFANHRKENGVS